MMTRVVRGLTGVVALTSVLLVAPSFAQAQGVGVGVKAGYLHSSFDVANAFNSGGDRWQAGLFFGGNRPGAVGFMGEFNVQSRKVGDASAYYFQVPALLRLNVGSSSASGPSVYGIVGPALDLRFADDLDVNIDAIESVDVSLVAGVGFEIARFIIEGRGSWGFRNIAKQSTIVDVKQRTFTILFGVRFN
jgi:hypothetical protein